MSICVAVAVCFSPARLQSREDFSFLPLYTLQVPLSGSHVQYTVYSITPSQNLVFSLANASGAGAQVLEGYAYIR